MVLPYVLATSDMWLHGRSGNPNPSSDDCNRVHSFSNHTCELAEQSGTTSNRSDASSSSSPENCHHVDASSSLPSETRLHVCARPQSNDTSFLPVVNGGICPLQVPNAHKVHFDPLPLVYNRSRLEEHEHHPSCSLTKDRQNDNFQGNIFSDRQAKVQITMQVARERVSQLMPPRQEDNQSGTHLLDRLMQKIEDRKFVQNLAITLVSFFKGNGLEKSWIYYGGHFFQSGEQTGWYKTAYMYPCTIIASVLISWIAILTRIARRLSVSSKILISGSEVTHPFCTLVFGSWDFGISSPEAASRLRKGLRMHFREMLADISAHEKKLLTLSTKTKRYKRYVALGILWPLQIAASVTIIVLLVSQAEKVNKTFKTDYAQSLLLTLSSMIAPLSIPFLVQLEDWNPATSERIVLLKLFSLRLVNACTLFYRLYMALAQAAHVKAGNQILACTSHKGCPDGFSCCNTNSGKEWVSCTPNQGQVCMPGCMENAVAKQLLRLMLTNTFVSVAWDLIYGMIHQRVFKKRRQLSIENLVIDIVYMESLVWVGSSFSPVAPVLGLFCNFMIFSYMKFSLRRFYEPMRKPYSASRTSNLTHGLLLLALILCSLPASATLVQKSSGVCGPIAENSSMYQTLSDYIEETPTLFKVILQWLGNPAILMGLILLLIFVLIILREKLMQTQFSFQARYKMFTTCCLLTLNQGAEQEKIRLLSKQVLDS